MTLVCIHTLYLYTCAKVSARVRKPLRKRKACKDNSVKWFGRGGEIVQVAPRIHGSRTNYQLDPGPLPLFFLRVTENPTCLAEAR